MLEGEKVLDEIERLWNDFVRTRAMTPHMMKKNCVGKTRLPAQDFHKLLGYDLTLEFTTPLTEQQIDANNAIGHWINESFIVRLVGYLEHNDVIPYGKSPDIGLDGGEEVWFLKQLRDRILNSAGLYDPDHPEDRELYQKIVDHFPVRGMVPEEPPSTPRQFPLPINKVMYPLKEGCKRYVEALSQ